MQETKDIKLNDTPFLVHRSTHLQYLLANKATYNTDNLCYHLHYTPLLDSYIVAVINQEFVKNNKNTRKNQEIMLYIFYTLLCTLNKTVRYNTL